jgi:Tfp pilus assembly protein PilF
MPQGRKTQYCFFRSQAGRFGAVAVSETHRSHDVKHSASSIAVLILLAGLITVQPAAASMAAVRALDVEKMSSPAALKAGHELMRATFADAAAAGTPGYELQKLLLEKAGGSISSIVESRYAQKLSADVARDLLKLNRELLSAILRHNQNIVADFQEHRLDSMPDTAGFFKSDAWQQPQHLISLAGYWQSWNGYYSALLMDSNEPGRTELLDRARQGFSRAFIDFQEQAIVTRSLFGRLLCHKEAGRYDSAMQDADTLLAMMTPADALYVRCRYEQLVIAYQRGSCAAVLKGVETFRDDIGSAAIPPAIAGGLKSLSVQCGIALLENAETTGAVNSAQYSRVLRDVRALVLHDPGRAPILYRFVSERPDIFVGMPAAELGAVGNLALADHLFKKQRWQEASERYAQVLVSGEAGVGSRTDEILFHLACCECKLERWQQAVELFNRLYREYSSSKHLAQASCYFYVASAELYRVNKNSENRQRYITAARRYLEKCPDQQNACEARYQLGLYYLEQQREQEALKQFERVKPGNLRYLEARFHIARARVDAFEQQFAAVAVRSSAGRSAHRQALQLVNEYAADVARAKMANKEQLRAYVATLQARLLMRGPDADYAGALKHLRGIPQAADRQTALRAAGLRIECLQNLGRREEVRSEIDALSRPPLSSEVWMALQQTAARLYAASQELRRTNDPRASEASATALYIYTSLFQDAQRSSARSEFLDALRLRIAEIHRDEQHIDMARKLYEEQLERDPSSADALYNLALIHEQQADWEQAHACWRRLTRGLQPGTPRWFEARRHTVIALKELGELKQACDYANMTLILHPDIADQETEQTFIRLREELCVPQPSG